MLSRVLKELLTNLGLAGSQSIFFYEEEDGRLFSFPTKETEKKLNIIKPTAFYVFNNQPYVLFFDLTNSVNSEREKEIHKQVWSFDQSPVIFLIKDGDIQIFNAFAYDKKLSRLQEIKLKNGEERDEIFSFWNLQSGNTWSWLQENHYKNAIQKKRVNQKLFENIKLVRETLTNQDLKNNLSEVDANILILRLIFIRYLIDRNVKIDTDFITGSTILERRKKFSELIEKPQKLNAFFEKLNEKFNGVLFKDIKIQLSSDHAQSLALVFSGEKPTQGTLFYGADFYFEIFDFSIIPVEVISGIYESLIDVDTRKLHSAVYTPSFLVECILAETVDKYFEKEENTHKTECTIFDPSVGSGIFLVQSFRRMIDREIAMSAEGKISKVRLREIAQNNLFGIDLNEQALSVTCFSIYIAILDYQDPKTILDNFHFPKLMGENLFGANFFDTNHQYNEIIKSKEIDFILGNPPWKSSKEDTHTKWLKANNKVTGRYEIAQSFLLHSKDFMQTKTVSALIVTSTIFYNISKPTKIFKQEFLTQFCLDSFFDLSPVRRLIFEEKNSPCSIVYYRLSDGKKHIENVVDHKSIKSNIFLKYYRALVIEKFDQKKIQQKHFIENDWMFKVALYGGALDFILFKKLFQNESKLDDIIDNKNIIIKGSGIKEKPVTRSFPFLIGLKCLENSEVDQYFTPSSRGRILGADDVILQSGRRKELFEGNQILLKAQAENESEIVISYTEKPVVFKHDVFGISTTTDKGTLFIIYAILVSELHTYFQFLSNCSWGIATRPAIRLEEYLSFPYKHPNETTQAQLIHLVNQFLSPYLEHYKEFNLGNPQKDNRAFTQINYIIDQLYGLKNYEKDLIDYVLEVSRYQFQESKQARLIRKIDNELTVLEQYARIFLDELKEIYLDEYLQVEVYALDHFIAMNFVFCKEKPKDEVLFKLNIEASSKQEIFDAIAKNISISEIAKELYVQKDIKGFEENSFFIIKPNEYKCWHRAMAWYDLTEIKEAIQSAELERLKTDF